LEAGERFKKLLPIAPVNAIKHAAKNGREKRVKKYGFMALECRKECNWR